MAVSVAEVRQAVAARVEAVTTPTALKESRWDLISGSEPTHYAHGAFACIVGTTNLQPEFESSRTMRPSGGIARTALTLRWLYTIKINAPVESFDEALDCEASIVAALSLNTTAGLRVSVQSMSRELIADGAWLRGELALRADHVLAIS